MARQRRFPGAYDATSPANAAKLDAADALGTLAGQAGLTLIQMAIAFATRHPAVTSTIIGPRTMEHLETYLAADGVDLPVDVLDRIHEIVPPGDTVNTADNMWSFGTSALQPAFRRRWTVAPMPAARARSRWPSRTRPGCEGCCHCRSKGRVGGSHKALLWSSGELTRRWKRQAMKAAVLEAFGQSLTVQTVPDPVVGTGEVVVDVVAAAVLPYSREVFSGERKYLLQLPAVPGAGAIGRVRAIGPDATRLKVGDWVACDPTVRSRDNALTPDITLLGLSARGEGGQRLQNHFRHGTFAEQVLLPTENAVPIGSIEADAAGRWCALNLLLVPFGGLLAADLQAGETVLVSGSTGNFGSAAVAVAVAMGAGCVIAPGRNRQVLADLERRFGPRVRTVELTGDEQHDRQRMTGAAPGPIDCVLDLLSPTAGTRPVRAAAMTVRERGRVVLMGGVGMLGGDDLALPYPWIMRNSITLRGQWMYPRTAITHLIGLIRAGLVDLEQFATDEFDLDQANDAVAHAAETAGAFRITVLRP